VVSEGPMVRVPAIQPHFIKKVRPSVLHPPSAKVENATPGPLCSFGGAHKFEQILPDKPFHNPFVKVYRVAVKTSALHEPSSADPPIRNCS